MTIDNGNTEDPNDTNNITYLIQDRYFDNMGSKWLTVKQIKIDEIKISRSIVLPKEKMIFFLNLKSVSTYWKCLLYVVENNKPCPLKSKNTKFLSLTNYTTNDVVNMMLGDSWTKITIVRDPRERILSAYLHKAVRENYVENRCKRKVESFSAFIDLIKTCKDPHWRPQIYLPKPVYKNFIIGKMSVRNNISQFTESILKRMGAWERMKDWIRNTEDFSERKHPTFAKDQIAEYFNREIEDNIISMYKEEYEVFGFDDDYFT